MAGWCRTERPPSRRGRVRFRREPQHGIPVGGLSRLDDARQSHLELLHDLPEGSQVAVLDTGDDGSGDEGDDDWSSTPAQALRRSTACGPGGCKRRWSARSAGPPTCWPRRPRVVDRHHARLYVFSDRTATSWDADEAKRLKVPEGIDTAYIDLGVDEPRDLAIDSVDVTPQRRGRPAAR